MRRWTRWMACVVAALALSLVATPAPGADAEYEEALAALKGDGRGVTVIALEDAEMFFEINSTDEDAGLQLFVDGVAWKRLKVFNPKGDKILDFTAQGEMRELGLTELRFESAEPDAETALELFAPGSYVFIGRAIDGRKLVGVAELSDEIAPAPEFSPADGAIIEPDDAVVEWKPIEDVETYEVIVESDEAEGALDVILPGSTTRLEIPDGFLEAGTEYKIEVLAKLENGNQTLTEHIVTTSGEDDDLVRPAAIRLPVSPMGPRIEHVRPNPLTASTTVRYALARGGPVLVQVLDVQGRLVRTLVNGAAAAGAHEATWDGHADDGSAAGTGIYFLNVRAEGASARRKLVLAR